VLRSLPPLREELLRRGERLAILRMDGDMYDSTADILYNLYELVEVGGFVVIDGASSHRTHRCLLIYCLSTASHRLSPQRAREPSGPWSGHGMAYLLACA